MGFCAFFDDSSAAAQFSGIGNSYGTEVKNEGYRDLATYIRAGLSAEATGPTACAIAISDDWVAYQFALKPGSATADRTALIQFGIC